MSLLFLITSCLDPIAFESSDNQGLLVIDGQLNPSDEDQIIRISRTVEFGDKFLDPVEGASVKLVYNDDSDVYEELEPGVYRLIQNEVEITEGGFYHVEIVLRDGSTYQSTPAEMPAVQKADSAYFSIETGLVTARSGIELEQRIVQVYVDSDVITDDDNPAYLRWYVDEYYSFAEPNCGGLHQPKTCYVPLEGNPQDITLFTSRDLGIERIEGLRVATKSMFPEVEFRGLHYFNVNQFALSQEAYEYWEKVEESVSQEGTVFDRPPARIGGNIFNVDDRKEVVLGYFEVANLHIVRAKMLPSDYTSGLARSPVCSVFQTHRWLPECCNCLRIPNSTTIRPSWF